MGFNSNLEFKEELDQALIQLDLQIEALDYFNRFLPSTSQFLVAAKHKLAERKELILLVLEGLDVLKNNKELLDKDGYPSSDFSNLLQDAFREADNVIRNSQNAEALLKSRSQTMATRVEIHLGIPEDKE